MPKPTSMKEIDAAVKTKKSAPEAKSEKKEDDKTLDADKKITNEIITMIQNEGNIHTKSIQQMLDKKIDDQE